nr:hypothetical protein [Tanacetum cinerariifolium]
MWYFPIIPRLQRLFKIRSTLEDLRWHATWRIKNGVLHHLADSQAWRIIDEKFPKFAKDPRNLRLGISADGVDIKTGNRHHSNRWLMIYIPYSRQGTDTDDASTKDNFNLCAVVLWIINYYPALGTLCSCPYSGFKGNKYTTRYNILKISREKEKTNNKAENQEDTRRRGGKIQIKKRNTTKEEGSSSQVNEQNDAYWKKFNIWYQKLRYWRHHSVPHCIDFMHVEKNVAESLVKTLLNVSRKTKDGVDVRLALAELGVKPELFAMQEKDKTILPPTDYTLTNAKKDIFCKPLYNIRVPQGYCSNFFSLVSLKDRKLIGLKLHDYHMLMQDKEIRLQELDKMQAELVVTLRLLEKFFPPNKPEGCIAEATIAEETIEFFSEYHKSMETIGIPPDKHETDENKEGKPLSVGKSSEVSAKLFQKAHLAGGVKRDTTIGYILVDLNNLGHKVDPFILYSQVRQVFYVKDQIKKLFIVFKTPPKNYKDTYDEVDEEFNSSDDSNGPSIPRIPVYRPSVQGLLDNYSYDNIEDYLSYYYFPSTDKEDTIVQTGQDPIHECHSLNSKAKYVPVSHKHNLNVKSPIAITGCVLGPPNVDTWDDILKKFGMRTHERCADKLMNGKDYGKDNHHVFCICNVGQMVCLHLSDDSKGVSCKGPSIKSIPKEKYKHEEGELTANYLFMTKLQPASLNTNTDLVYERDGISEVPNFDHYYDNEIDNLFSHEEQHHELHESTQDDEQHAVNDEKIKA